MSYSTLVFGCELTEAMLGGRRRGSAAADPPPADVAVYYCCYGVFDYPTFDCYYYFN